MDYEGTVYFRLGSQGMGQGKFKEPRDVAYDHRNQRVLVSDSKNHCIQILDLNGRFSFSFGIKGREKGAFMFPQGMPVDQQGCIYVADQENILVQIFNQNGTFLNELVVPIEKTWRNWDNVRRETCGFEPRGTYGPNS